MNDAQIIAIVREQRQIGAQLMPLLRQALELARADERRQAQRSASKSFSGNRGVR